MSRNALKSIAMNRSNVSPVILPTSCSAAIPPPFWPLYCLATQQMMFVYGTSYAALILFVQILFESLWRFMWTTRSRGIESIITRLVTGSMLMAMIESVR